MRGSSAADALDVLVRLAQGDKGKETPVTKPDQDDDGAAGALVRVR